MHFLLVNRKWRTESKCFATKFTMIGAGCARVYMIMFAESILFGKTTTTYVALKATALFRLMQSFVFVHCFGRRRHMTTYLTCLWSMYVPGIHVRSNANHILVPEKSSEKFIFRSIISNEWFTIGHKCHTDNCHADHGPVSNAWHVVVDSVNWRRTTHIRHWVRYDIPGCAIVIRIHWPSVCNRHTGHVCDALRNALPFAIPFRNFLHIFCLCIETLSSRAFS